MVWQGDELDPAKYIVELSHRDIQDIRAAVIKIKSKYAQIRKEERVTNTEQSPELTDQRSASIHSISATQNWRTSFRP